MKSELYTFEFHLINVAGWLLACMLLQDTLPGVALAAGGTLIFNI